MPVIVLILLLTAIGASAQDPYKNVYSSHAWAERDRWQRADELIEMLDVGAGDHVADIGCHEGYMTFKLARIVGSGKVYAVDIDESKLEKLRNAVAENRISNVEAIRGDEDNPRLPVNSLDGVIILDTYHEMDAYATILQHIYRALKPGGRLVICEPIAEERRGLERGAQTRRHELGMNYALDDLGKAGFRILRRYDRFIDRKKEKGDEMWVVVAVKG